MKKRSKLMGRGVRIPSHHDQAVHKTERSGVAVIAGWIREITVSKGLPLGNADVDTSGPDGKSPDLVIYENPGGSQVLLLGEFKQPYYDAFDEVELKTPARDKANRRKAPYFLTSNFRQLVWYSTQRANEMAPDEQQLMAAPYDLSTLESLDLLEEPRVSSAIRRELERFLDDLVAVHYGKRPVPKLPLDSYLVARIHVLVDQLARRYHGVVAERAHKDRPFEKSLAAWFQDQMWSYTRSEADYAKVARQAAYLLVNKILFYHVLQSRRPRDLDPLEIPESITRGNLLHHHVQNFFNDVMQNIDYETIYSTDFIDEIAFPRDVESVRLVRVLNELLRRHDVGKLGYDILGPIFERLIPPLERHNLGQYFTNPDVVDMILGYCIRKEGDVALDPSCGAGTFLVRAYQHKSLMNPRMVHEELLKTLWGVDIAKFPAHLSMINLALNDLTVQENYPQVLQKDFFELSPHPITKKAKRFEVKRFSGETASVAFPSSVDAIVGNPPYTRQEEIDLIAPSGGYKGRLVDLALLNAGPGAQGISGQAGIHTYFFIHGTKFLQTGGRFGFVVSDTWLDAGFGVGLKRFLLLNYRVSMVIASKVERWFADADINTCIVLLERETDEAKRGNGMVRFIQLKKPLRELIPTGGGPREERLRLEAVGKLYELFSAHNARYENDDARIVPVIQSSLSTDSKWGLFLRAPSLLFEISNRNNTTLKPFNAFSQVCFGVKTGADPWFYVKDVSEGAEAEIKQKAKSYGYRGKLDSLVLIESGDGTKWLVESEFLVPVARNPDQYHAIRIETKNIPDLAVVLPAKEKSHLKNKLVLHYIVHGERRTYSMGKGRKLIPAKTESCKARPFWYSLPDIQWAHILWEKAVDVRFRQHLADKPLLANQRFYPIVPPKNVSVTFLAGFLNSAFVALWLEVQRAALGQGALEATVDEVKNLLVADPREIPAKAREDVERAVVALAGREVGKVFQEYGADTPEEVKWERIPSDRRALEDAVLEGVLGLSEPEKVELVRSLVDLTRSRLARAHSVDAVGQQERAAMKEFTDQVVKGMPLV